MHSQLLFMVQLLFYPLDIPGSTLSSLGDKQKQQACNLAPLITRPNVLNLLRLRHTETQIQHLKKSESKRHMLPKQIKKKVSVLIKIN